MWIESETKDSSRGLTRFIYWNKKTEKFSHNFSKILLTRREVFFVGVPILTFIHNNSQQRQQNTQKTIFLPLVKASSLIAETVQASHRIDLPPSKCTAVDSPLELQLVVKVRMNTRGCLMGKDADKNALAMEEIMKSIRQRSIHLETRRICVALCALTLNALSHRDYLIIHWVIIAMGKLTVIRWKVEVGRERWFAVELQGEFDDKKVQKEINPWKWSGLRNWTSVI